MEQLFLIFNSIRPISKPLENYLRGCLLPATFKKGEVIFEEGKVADRIYFIEYGKVQSLENLDGTVRTMYFMRKGDIIISVISFFNQQKSVETVVAMENCKCWYISYEQLQKAYEEYPEFNYHRGVILEKYYIASEERNRMRLRKEEDRYIFVMEKETWLLQKGGVTRAQLASYLGVSLRTLANYKNKYKNRTRRKL